MQVFTCISQRRPSASGDIGTHGPVDEAGSVEIGYGLAAPSRGQGYGSEAVAAVTGWLLSQPGVRQVRAHTLTSNAPSRRVLEKAGFTHLGLDGKPTADGGSMGTSRV